MEQLANTAVTTPVRAVLFDFDGTISTLRHGWEDTMKPLMLEMIRPDGHWGAELEAMVDRYIDESTGTQTIHQMKWLAQTVGAMGMYPGAPTDPWWYKAEYNRRLMRDVEKRLRRLRSGERCPGDFMMAGSVDFLRALKRRGVRMFVASGTDHADVVNEFVAIGDGKVEIRLAREAGARAETRQRRGRAQGRQPRQARAADTGGRDRHRGGFHRHSGASFLPGALRRAT